MGCDIHCYAEYREEGKWKRNEHVYFPDDFNADHLTIEPFGWRSYAMFGFLADVRNYSHCTPLSEPRGLPDDSEYLNGPSDYSRDFSGKSITTLKQEIEGDWNYHSHSYLFLNELLDFDYDQTFWDRRISKQIGPNSWSGKELAEEGEGEVITYREHLGEFYFKHLEMLKELGSPEDVRIVIWFDN